jgi:ferredoxin
MSTAAALIRLFRADRLVIAFPADPDVPVLDLAEEAGFEIPRGCTSGNCGTCMVRLISGVMELPDPLPPGLDAEIVALGARLTCIGLTSGPADLDLIPPL